VIGSGRADPRSPSLSGQATVETALLFPVVVVVLLALVQVGLVVHARIMVTHACREGVRVAAVGGSADEVAAAVAAAGRLPPDRLTVDLRTDDGWVVLAVRYQAPTNVPMVGALLGSVILTAEAAMRQEPEGPMAGSLKAPRHFLR